MRRDNEQMGTKLGCRVIIWLTGQSGAGKSALAEKLQASIGGIILDGDSMRASISLNAGFSRKDRREHNLRVARLASVLSEQCHVIVSVIAPMVGVRNMIDLICKPFWVYVKRTLPEREGHFYEEPPNDYPNDYFVVDHDVLPVSASVVHILSALEFAHPIYSAFIGRFQLLHGGHIALIRSVLDEGRDVLIMLRDTPISPKNPFTIAERKLMFEYEFGDRVRVVVIPDILEVCYGRDVGWGMREIKLDDELEAISGTKLRELEKVAPSMPQDIIGVVRHDSGRLDTGET